MKDQLVHDRRGGILWFTARGTRAVDTLVSFSSRLMTVCEREDIPRALVDMRAMTGALTANEAFELPARHFPKLRNRQIMSHLAILDLPDHENEFSFFEMAVQGRGMNIRVFYDEELALEWVQTAE